MVNFGKGRSAHPLAISCHNAYTFFMVDFQINNPSLWRADLPQKKGRAHKYDYGHAVIYGAPSLTGATRLAAEACARVGAGLVTVLAPQGKGDIYRVTLPAHVLVRDDTGWRDERVSVRLYGSGGMAGAIDYDQSVPTVLDADALQNLPEKLGANYILTPHEGEFARAFPDIKGSREERALSAAQNSGAMIVLKGAETLIVSPDGRMVVNKHASPYLATAGSGDVLAGMIAGLLAQGMPAFEAACAAVWMHGDAAIKFGAGLVACDLPDLLPKVLQDLS